MLGYYKKRKEEVLRYLYVHDTQLTKRPEGHRIHTKGNYSMPERFRPGKNQAETQSRQGKKDIKTREKRKSSKKEKKPGWQPSNEVTASILSTPLFTLHIGNNSEGEEAFNALDEAGIHFRIVKTDDLEIPYTTYNEVFPEENEDRKGYEGTKYEGVGGTKAIAHVWNSAGERLHDAMLKRDPRAFEGGDPEFGKWMDEMEERQRERNYEIMYGEGIKPKEKRPGRPRKA